MVDRDSQADAVHPWAGTKIVFTGQLNRISRAQAVNLSNVLGAEVVGKVDQASFVVVGADSGRRASQALKLGVPTLDERQFVESAIEAVKKFRSDR